MYVVFKCIEVHIQVECITQLLVDWGMLTNCIFVGTRAYRNEKCCLQSRGEWVGWNGQRFIYGCFWTHLPSCHCTPDVSSRQGSMSSFFTPWNVSLLCPKCMAWHSVYTEWILTAIGSITKWCPIFSTGISVELIVMTVISYINAKF